MNKEFRKVRADDDLEKIAELIYYTDNYIYPYWFENLENCKKELPELIKEDKFFYNINNLYIATIDDQIVGLICVVDKETDLDYDYEKLRNKNERYRLTIDKYISGMIEEVKKEDFAYISNVCVDQNYRGQHIATFMLEKLKNIYVEKYYEKIFLEVLADNPSAIHLYEKMGFGKSGEIYNGFPGDDPSGKVDVIPMMIEELQKEPRTK